MCGCAHFLKDMTDVAPCKHGHCDECALRQIIKNDFSEYSCYGGFDIATHNFILPCTTCNPPAPPATQDYEDFDFTAFLEGLQNEEADDAQASFDLGKLMFGEDIPVQQVFEDVMAWQASKKRSWSHIHLPVHAEGSGEDNDGKRVRMRLYKPFGRYIEKEEEEDFNNFLHLIF